MGWLHCVAGLALLLSLSSSQECPDEYLYTQQPPEDLVCNPYARGSLEVDCVITGEDIIDIQWYFQPQMSSDTIQIMNSSKYNLTPHRESGFTGVLLRINGLDESEDLGKYWCQGFVTGGSLTTSARFMLLSEDSYFDMPCGDSVFRRSGTLCAEIIRTTQEVTTLPPTTLPQTTHPLTSSNTPSTDRKTSSSTTVSVTTPNQIPSGDPLRASDFILYVVLGLVGFLGVICLLLGVVIVILCRKRCRGQAMNGSEHKEMRFDHLSNQSDFGSSIHKHTSPPYQPESTQPVSGDTQRRDLSGDYAEIGPALIMNSDHFRHLQSSYSDNGNPPPLPQSRFTAFRSNVGMEVNPYSISGYENPYDLPALPTADSGVGTEQMDVGTSQSYHVLERVVPSSCPDHEIEDNSELFSDTSSFSTPPDSPSHGYQTLQGVGAGSTRVEPNTSLSLLPHQQIEQVQVAPISFDFAQEYHTSRLETIPEHPYHVLVKDEPSGAQTAAVEPLPTMPVAPAVEAADDQEYDRLISPPHLYHILEHSPSLNKPRIHHFHFDDYNHLEKAPSSGREAAVSPQTLSMAKPGDLSQSYFSESCSDESDVFDDPQYLLSPESQRCSPSGELSSKEEGAATPSSRSGSSSQEAVSLGKYSGDYERDPVYMQRLQSISPKLHTASVQLSRGSDLTGSQDDSGFCSYGQQVNLPELRRQSSLPDVSHVYQPLQAKTMDPRLPYECIKKQGGKLLTERVHSN